MVNITDMKTEHYDLDTIDVLSLVFEKQQKLMEKYWTKPVWKLLNSVEAQWLIRRFTKYTLEEIWEAFEEVEKKYHWEYKWLHWLNFEEKSSLFHEKWVKELLNQDELEHCYEEIADSLHFYVEKLCISNVLDPDVLYQYIEDYIRENTWDEVQILTYQDLEKAVIKYSLPKYEEKNNWKWYDLWTVYQAIASFTIYINIADNFLRSKEWQKDQKEVFIEWYHKALWVSLYHFVLMLLTIWIDAKIILDLYIRKNKVNNFRINSNY